MSEDKGPNTCGCRGRGWGWGGGLCELITQRVDSARECYGDMHGNRAKCSEAWRACVCSFEAQPEREVNRNMLSVDCVVCRRVCVCEFLHIAAFPYSPGVRWGLLSSNWTYWPLSPLSTTCPLMSGKSFTSFFFVGQHSCSHTLSLCITQTHTQISTHTETEGRDGGGIRK